ncbi:hypothetical protein ACWEV3_15605 [Saccharopolyspora sp. NPDC003752]
MTCNAGVLTGALVSQACGGLGEDPTALHGTGFGVVATWVIVCVSPGFG